MNAHDERIPEGAYPPPTRRAYAPILPRWKPSEAGRLATAARLAAARAASPDGCLCHPRHRVRIDVVATEHVVAVGGDAA